MNWQVVSRPEAEIDVIEIAEWYDSRRQKAADFADVADRI